MSYEFIKMSQTQAEDIAYHWHYDGEYSFYDFEADPEDLAEFLDPKGRGHAYYVVKKENQIIGFFSFNEDKDHSVDIGLGIKPEWTGRGYGFNFLKAGLKYAVSKFNPQKMTLSVATFNQRAIKVYEKAGFKPVEIFMQDTNGSRFEFLKMEYECKHK
ncbi:ribosomal-protein-alanine N-acetyltransferase [Bacillus pakistanensis]|uniref:Ribosomal-protein-alanine N-acetyltransferase n=1 Tax=Rossellomorea pakistanensis TaxID=992288 RepID=A0ABS2NH51_9BACI|nr:GNAT family protein [Bacillus pakistanensis]MBM7587148.1 ribosomal-protein-alanine N-acetyltransferase [Bacillus pakistanensis]